MHSWALNYTLFGLILYFNVKVIEFQIIFFLNFQPPPIQANNGLIHALWKCAIFYSQLPLYLHNLSNIYKLSIYWKFSKNLK